MTAILCPRCPYCGGEPDFFLLVTWPAQAWCSDPGCRVLCWDPRKATEDLQDVDPQEVEFPDGWHPGDPIRVEVEDDEVTPP